MSQGLPPQTQPPKPFAKGRVGLQSVLEELVVERAVAPGATAAFAVNARGSWHIVTAAAGKLLSLHPDSVTPTTVYDIASLSKPVTACVAARLEARLPSGLATPLGELLPEAQGTQSEATPIELLLAHRAGLLAHVEFFAPLREGSASVDRRQLLGQAADGRRSECVGPPPEAGFAPVYSDLGYILVGEALASYFGCPLDQLVEQEINRPLDLKFASAAQLGATLDVAPTEPVAWRGGYLKGVVHDDNAWALAGKGSAGHAGLFADASCVAGFGVSVVDAVLGRSHWLSQAAAARLVQPRPGGSLLAGFDSRSKEGSSAGRLFGPRSFGHLGFTGTSMWCDPDAEIVGVLLTNRVSLGRQHLEIREARPAIHDNLYRHALVLRQELEAD